MFSIGALATEYAEAYKVGFNTSNWHLPEAAFAVRLEDGFDRLESTVPQWYHDIAFLSNLESAPAGATMAIAVCCVMAIAVASPHGSQFLIAVRSLPAEVVASGLPGPAASCGSSA